MGPTRALIVVFCMLALVACGETANPPAAQAPVTSPAIIVTASQEPSPTPTQSIRPSPSASAIAWSPATPAPCTSPLPQTAIDLTQAYRNSDLGFSIGYPEGFTWEVQSGSAGGSLLLARAYEKNAIATSGGLGYPWGQVEVGVWPFDAPSLRDWVAKRTGDTDPEIWMATANLADGAVGQRPAVTFDWTGPEIPPDGVHDTVFVFNGRFVFAIEWWAANSCYSDRARRAEQAMATSFSTG